MTQNKCTNTTCRTLQENGKPPLEHNGCPDREPSDFEKGVAVGYDECLDDHSSPVCPKCGKPKCIQDENEQEKSDHTRHFCHSTETTDPCHGDCRPKESLSDILNDPKKMQEAFTEAARLANRDQIEDIDEWNRASLLFHEISHEKESGRGIRKIIEYGKKMREKGRQDWTDSIRIDRLDHNADLGTEGV